MTSKAHSTASNEMNISRRAVLATVPSAFALLGMHSNILWSQQDKYASLTPPAARKPAPPFEVLTHDGKKLRVASYKGKVLLLNFWATDCGGCVLEIPSFIEIVNAHKHSRFDALGIAMDIPYEGLKTPAEAWNRVAPFVAKKGINYSIAMGDEAIAQRYGIDAYPATYLLDQSGRIAVVYKGVVIDKNNVEHNIKALLAEGP